MMNKPIIITVEGIPQPWPKKQISMSYPEGGGRKRPFVYTRDPKGKWTAWKQSFTLQVKKHMMEHNIAPFEKGIPLALGTIIIIPRPKSVTIEKRPYPTVRPDYDNYKYGIVNLLKGLLFYDDDQIVADLPGGMYYDDNFDSSVQIILAEIKSPPLVYLLWTKNTIFKDKEYVKCLIHKN